MYRLPAMLKRRCNVLLDTLAAELDKHFEHELKMAGAKARLNNPATLIELWVTYNTNPLDAIPQTALFLFMGVEARRRSEVLSALAGATVDSKSGLSLAWITYYEPFDVIESGVRWSAGFYDRETHGLITLMGHSAQKHNGEEVRETISYQVFLHEEGMEPLIKKGIIAEVLGTTLERRVADTFGVQMIVQKPNKVGMLGV